MRQHILKRHLQILIGTHLSHLYALLYDNLCQLRRNTGEEHIGT